MNTRKMTLLGLLIAVALLATYIEYLLPSPIASMPGIKLGLANVIILALLYLFHSKTSLYVNILRILLAALLFTGFIGGMYALVGGFFSFISMYLAKRSSVFSILGVSVIGATSHNVGQILVSAIILQNRKLFYYLPILTISAIITGLIVGLIAFYLVRHLSTYCKKFI